MPNNNLKNNIPDWLYSHKALGKHNPAALETEDLLALQPVKKKIIFDLNTFKLDSKMCLQTLSVLLEVGFDIYCFVGYRLNKINDLNELTRLFDESNADDPEDKYAHRFNSVTMWKILFENGFNRKVRHYPWNYGLNY